MFVSLLTFSLFVDIRNWIRNIEQHASDNVNKILVGNKADMDESKRVSFFLSYSHISLILLAFDNFLSQTLKLLQAVPTSKGQALADEYGIKFFETVSITYCVGFNTKILNLIHIFKNYK